MKDSAKRIQVPIVVAQTPYQNNIYCKEEAMTKEAFYKQCAHWPSLMSCRDNNLFPIGIEGLLGTVLYSTC